MYDRILLAVDGSEASRRAARHGFALADALDAAVEVLHVVEGSSLGLARSTDEKAALRERGEEIVGEIEALASERGLTVTTRVDDGSPAVRISEYAVDRDASLIVVGRQGRSGLGKRLLGGVTEGVLARSPVPVVVVPGSDSTPEPEPSYSRILVPTDGSETAAVAARHGATLARGRGTPVHALNVVDLQAAGGPFDAGGLPAEFVERLEERGSEAVEEVASVIEATAPDLDVTTAVIRTSSFEGVAAGIREYVREHDVDLVAMGSHGRSNLERRLLGSVTSTLLRTVDVPVVVVDRSAADPDLDSER